MALFASTISIKKADRYERHNGYGGLKPLFLPIHYGIYFLTIRVIDFNTIVFDVGRWPGWKGGILCLHMLQGVVSVTIYASRRSMLTR